MSNFHKTLLPVLYWDSSTIASLFFLSCCSSELFYSFYMTLCFYSNCTNITMVNFGQNIVENLFTKHRCTEDHKLSNAGIHNWEEASFCIYLHFKCHLMQKQKTTHEYEKLAVKLESGEMLATYWRFFFAWKMF